MREAKAAGFSDVQIGRACGRTAAQIRAARKGMGILPQVKQIDSLAAEWPAATNYLYMTYGGTDHDIAVPAGERAAMVLGAGPYRIGSSVEFDWGTVNMVWGIREHDIPVAVVNCNPETVSTDYDICNRLYFEELTHERVMDIVEFENPRGVVTSVGGQAANNLTPSLAASGVPILGTSATDVDRAEDRSKFSAELDKLHIRQPRWQAFSSLEGARTFARDVGFPVLVRPSYVLSGAAMKVVWSADELETYTQDATRVSPDHPVVISKFMLNSLEVDVDGVSDGDNVIIGAVVEHIDSAGVHSGDAMMCIPPWRLGNMTVQTITEYTVKIARTFRIRGPFNLQFLVHDGEVYVIELNIRASRSMPFVSKLVGMNLISLASRAVMGGKLPAVPHDRWREVRTVGIKVPQFSFMQLEGADLTLGVEMHSTGEAACFGESFYDALSKALGAVGYNLPSGGSALITVGGTPNKEKLLATVAKLGEMGFNILATEHTAEFLEERLGAVKVVHKISEPERQPNIADLLYQRKIGLYHKHTRHRHPGKVHRDAGGRVPDTPQGAGAGHSRAHHHRAGRGVREHPGVDEGPRDHQGSDKALQDIDCGGAPCRRLFYPAGMPRPGTAGRSLGANLPGPVVLGEHTTVLKPRVAGGRLAARTRRSNFDCHPAPLRIYPVRILNVGDRIVDILINWNNCVLHVSNLFRCKSADGVFRDFLRMIRTMRKYAAATRTACRI